MSISRIKLKKGHLKLYMEFRKAIVVKGGGSISVGLSNPARIYNGLLHDFLIDCQKKRFLPSKEYVSERCIALSSESERIDCSGDSSSEALSVVRIDEAIQNMNFFPAMALRNGVGKGDNWLYYYLEVFGIIPLEGLNEAEVVFLEGAFKRKALRDEGQIDVKILSLMASDRVSEQLQDKINDVCLRIARDVFSKYAEINGYPASFKYTILQRIRDYFTKLEV